MPPPKCKKGLQSFLGTINYLSKFSPATVEVCEKPRRLTSVRLNGHGMEHTKISMRKPKKVITKDTCMKFYDTSKPLYLEMDASDFGLGAGQLQM